MCAARADLRPDIYKIEGQPRLGETLIFCNGIETTHKDSQLSGQAISHCFGNREVFVLHNPTSFTGYTLANYTSDLISLREQGILSRALKDLIQSQIQRHQENPTVDKAAIRIILFVHSHGARLAFGALHALEDVQRQNIHVYAFGGAVLIPRNFARVARNYFLAGDGIAEKANTKGLDPKLGWHLDIHARMKRAPEEMPAEEKQKQAIFDCISNELGLEDVTLRNAPREEIEQDPKFPVRKKQIEECFAAYHVITTEPRDISADLKGFNRTLVIHGLNTYFNEYLAGIRAQIT